MGVSKVKKKKSKLGYSFKCIKTFNILYMFHILVFGLMIDSHISSDKHCYLKTLTFQKFLKC